MKLVVWIALAACISASNPSLQLDYSPGLHGPSDLDLARLAVAPSIAQLADSSDAVDDSVLRIQYGSKHLSAAVSELPVTFNASAAVSELRTTYNASSPTFEQYDEAPLQSTSSQSDEPTSVEPSFSILVPEADCVFVQGLIYALLPLYLVMLGGFYLLPLLCTTYAVAEILPLAMGLGWMFTLFLGLVLVISTAGIIASIFFYMLNVPWAYRMNGF